MLKESPGKGTAFHSLSRLDLDDNTSVSLSRYFNHGLLAGNTAFAGENISISRMTSAHAG